MKQLDIGQLLCFSRACSSQPRAPHLVLLPLPSREGAAQSFWAEGLELTPFPTPDSRIFLSCSNFSILLFPSLKLLPNYFWHCFEKPLKAEGGNINCPAAAGELMLRSPSHPDGCLRGQRAALCLPQSPEGDPSP